MYKIAEIKQGQLPRLSELPIKAQSQIIAEVGEPLDLVKTYSTLKAATSDFKVKNEVAEELDRAMVKLLTQKGFFKTDASAPPKEPAKKEKSKKEQAQTLIDDLKETLEYLDATEAAKTQELINDLMDTLEYLD